MRSMASIPLDPRSAMVSWGHMGLDTVTRYPAWWLCSHPYCCYHLFEGVNVHLRCLNMFINSLESTTSSLVFFLLMLHDIAISAEALHLRCGLRSSIYEERTCMIWSCLYLLRLPITVRRDLNFQLDRYGKRLVDAVGFEPTTRPLWAVGTNRCATRPFPL